MSLNQSLTVMQYDTQRIKKTSSGLLLFCYLNYIWVRKKYVTHEDSNELTWKYRFFCITEYGPDTTLQGE
jgi:hypothetical protein